MQWEWTEQPDFEKGKRYLLKVSAAERKYGKMNGTEMLVLKFEDEEGQSAGDKTFFNTPKAAWRIKDWLAAFGYDISECRCGFDTQELVGMQVYAESSRRKSTNPEEPDKEFLEWIKPQSALPAGTQPKTSAQQPEQQDAAAKAAQEQRTAEGRAAMETAIAAPAPAPARPQLSNPEDEIPF